MRYQDDWLTDEIPGRHRMMSKWGYTSLTGELPGRHRMTSKWGYISLTDEMPSSRFFGIRLLPESCYLIFSY